MDKPKRTGARRDNAEPSSETASAGKELPGMTGPRTSIDELMAKSWLDGGHPRRNCDAIEGERPG